MKEKFIDNFENSLIWQGYDPDWKTPGKPILANRKEVDESFVRKGYGTFFTVNGFNVKREESDIKNLNAVFGDFDTHEEGKPDNIEKKIQEKLKDIFFVLEPTYVVRTKNGIHVYWLLDEKIYKDDSKNWKDEFAQYLQILGNIKDRFSFDSAASEAVRVLRLPGYPHQKDLNDPYDVKIIHQNDACRYSLNNLSEIFPLITKSQITESKKESKKFFSKIEREYPRINRPSTRSLLSGTPGTLPKDFARHTAAMISAIIMRDAGIPKEEALITLFQSGWHDLVKERPRDIPSVVEDVYKKRTSYFVTDNVACIKHNITKEERETLKQAKYEVTVKDLPSNDNQEESQIRASFVKNRIKGTYDIAKYLTNKYSIITVGEKEREMFVYRDGKYFRAENEIIYPETQRILGEVITKSAKMETFHKIADMTSCNRDIFTSAP